MLEVETHSRHTVLRLNDPAKRNALSLPMFDALDDAVAALARDNRSQVVLLCGAGKAFCAGFDLAAAVTDPNLIAEYIHRLSALNRQLRRLPQVVIASVHGAAIAGGCAILSACDFVIAAPDATLGYPVHQLGISPAVTIPTLQQAIGSSQARTLLLSGDLIDGLAARMMGLVTHLADSMESLPEESRRLIDDFASKPPNALRTTKRWLSELDGSIENGPFDGPANGSAGLAAGDEARSMLAAFWKSRAAASSQGRASEAHIRIDRPGTD